MKRRTGGGADPQKTQGKQEPPPAPAPLRPMRRLLVAMLLVFLVWLIFLLTLYFTAPVSLSPEGRGGGLPGAPANLL